MKNDVKQAEKIIDHYNKIIASSYEGLLIKATLLNKSKKQSEAYEIAKELMDTFPNRPNGYLQAIPYYGQTKDKKAAISLLEKGYLNVKDNRKLLILLTTFQVEEKKFDIVERRIRAELKSSPDDAQLKILLSKVYVLQDKVNIAESLLHEVIEANSSVEEPYLLLSQIYQNKKDPNSVKSILTKGRSNLKTSLKIALRLAGVYEAEESYKKAIDIYRDLYKTYPGNSLNANTWHPCCQIMEMAMPI